jgi:hypothetical protein
MDNKEFRNIMKTHAKSMVALASGAMLLPGLLSQTAQAQGLLNESGTSTLVDVFGTATGTGPITVSWSVVENASDIYTYSYTVNNTSGGAFPNYDDTLILKPEAVDAFSIDINTTLPGAYVPFSQTGGTIDQNNGANGLLWSFAAVPAVGGSPALSYESDLPPVLGDAVAQGSDPSFRWSAVHYNQQVPVPDTAIAVPEPTATALFGLTDELAAPALALGPAVTV